MRIDVGQVRDPEGVRYWVLGLHGLPENFWVFAIHPEAAVAHAMIERRLRPTGYPPDLWWASGSLYARHAHQATIDHALRWCLEHYAARHATPPGYRQVRTGWCSHQRVQCEACGLVDEGAPWHAHALDAPAQPAGLLPSEAQREGHARLAASHALLTRLAARLREQVPCRGEASTTLRALGYELELGVEGVDWLSADQAQEAVALLGFDGPGTVSLLRRGLACRAELAAGKPPSEALNWTNIGPLWERVRLAGY